MDVLWSGLVSEARKAERMAYAPYSRHRVGAAGMDAQGSSIVVGCNVENAAWSPSLCAECTLVGNAVLQSVRVAYLVVVHGERIITPCGRCRAILHEHNRDMVVLTADGEVTMDVLLPQAFEYKI